MANILANLRTSIMGLIGILGGLGSLGAALERALAGDFQWALFAAAFSAIAAGVGLIFAKDSNKSNAPAPLPEPQLVVSKPAK